MHSTGALTARSSTTLRTRVRSLRRPRANCRLPVLAALFASLLAAPLHAASAEGFEYLLTDEHLDINEVERQPGWQHGAGSPSFGFTASRIWIRVKAPPRPAKYLRISNAWLDRFDVYMVRDGAVIATYRSGKLAPDDERPIVHPHFVFPLEAKERADTVYLHDYGYAGARFPLHFESEAEFVAQTNLIHISHGLYYGLVLILALYAFAIYWGARDLSYVYFSFYALSLAAFLSTYDGIGNVYLWSNPDYVAKAALAMTIVFHIRFATHFMRLREYPGWLTGFFNATSIAVAVNAVLLMASPSDLGASLEPVFAIMTIVSLTAVSVKRTLDGDRAGRIYLIAASMIFLSGLVLALMQMGVLRHSDLTSDVLFYGSTLEIVMLSIGLSLGLRNRQRRELTLQDRSLQLAREVRELKVAKALAAEHRELQKTMRQAQKLRTVGQMSGGIAHDFNNILASVLGFTELALDQSSQDNRKTLMRYLDEIRKAAERGALLVKQLQVYSRGERRERRPLNLNTALDAVLQFLRGSLPATTTLELHLPDRPLDTVMDPAQLQQMVVNLALNASEAMDERGHIDIRLEKRDVNNALCASCLTRYSGEFLTIQVDDEGPGIDGSAHDLFTPFHTTKPVGQGSGLGLSVVHGIAHEYQGHVHVASKAGGGSRFTLHLPEMTVAGEDAVVGNRILLIEDDPSVASYLESLLQANEYQVTCASLPTEALEKFIHSPDAFDLVITDQVMPHGTGLELAQDMHELRPDLPVLLTTGNPDNLAPEALKASGVKAVFGKPLDSNLLLAKIRGLLSA